MEAKQKPLEKVSSDDGKVMATSSGNTMEKARTVEPDQITVNKTENSPISAYYEFPSSKVTQFETYPTRMEKISSILGNKDSVKG